ncbi:hypothetical protein QW060_22010 [Myroides ceti]|uniref:Glycosyltransferase n=1 Tax=Paenimyroides ceti TaxID=395087 RepID=A0ABT8CPK0_9FLAO|nr:hypothetical protein [Paenimyroides ceti]MDN3706408.1 hypothetical protein [Paenimyroides ceti]MDN3709639.1 hypothetical protein [Paenimyroides ceti]
MDVFIKSFNRPFLLDRCIASIYHYAVNFSRIVVMDDGTPQIYVEKLKNKYPDICFEFSVNYAEKSADILAGRYPKKEIPASLWKGCIEKGTPYFVLLEDDMWFTDFIDLKIVHQNLSDEHMSMVKFMWLNNKKLISPFVVQQESSFLITAPKLTTYKAVHFKRFFIENKYKVYSIAKRLGINCDDLLLAYYQIYIVAGGAFSKDYYNACWNQKQKTVNELSQIHQLLKARKKIELKVGHSFKEIIKASYKTTASSQNKEHLKDEFDVYQLNALLNKAWYADEMYELKDFQNDIPDAWIEKVLLHYTSDQHLYFLWKEWYKKFKQTYEEIGCSIINDK